MNISLICCRRELLKKLVVMVAMKPNCVVKVVWLLKAVVPIANRSSVLYMNESFSAISDKMLYVLFV